MWKTAVNAEDTYFFTMKWMIKAFSIICLLVIASVATVAQRPQYKITAALDTVAHTLKGSIDITYPPLRLPYDRLRLT